MEDEITYELKSTNWSLIFLIALAFVFFDKYLQCQNQEPEIRAQPTLLSCNENIIQKKDTLGIKKFIRECIFEASTPYDNAKDYIKYWKDSEAMQNYESVHCVDQRVILAKMWAETAGGTKGAGRRGANFGIKGKGIKGVDKKEYWSPKVEYQYYDQRWQSISHFCEFIKRPLYQKRFERWQKEYPKWEDWKLRLISLQVDPWLSRSKLSYASCGCKDGREKSCYQIRKKHALKNIQFIEKYF